MVLRSGGLEGVLRLTVSNHGVVFSVYHLSHLKNIFQSDKVKDLSSQHDQFYSFSLSLSHFSLSLPCLIQILYLVEGECIVAPKENVFLLYRFLFFNPESRIYRFKFNEQLWFFQRVLFSLYSNPRKKESKFCQIIQQTCGILNINNPDRTFSDMYTTLNWVI